MRTRAVLLGLCSLLSITLGACDGCASDTIVVDDGATPDTVLAPPAIVSFEASEAIVLVGQNIDLVATFTGASATISPGVGLVTSGVPVMVAANDDVYTLTVTGEDGTTRTRMLTLRRFDTLLTVSTTQGSGAGSLLEAVTMANTLEGETGIVFTLPASATIALDTATLVTTGGDVTVIGPGAETLTISGLDERRIWFVGGGTLRVEGVAFAHGLGAGGNGGVSPGSGPGGGGAGMGGAIFINAGDVTLVDVAFADNVARGGNGAIRTVGFANGGGGGGFGGNGANGSTAMSMAGGAGGPSGLLGGAPGTPSTPGGDGAGGMGAGAAQSQNGGAGGFGAGGGGFGGLAFAGTGGFGGAAGSGATPVSGTFGGTSANNASGGGAGLGGAVFLRTGTLAIDGAAFTNNHALRGMPGGGAATAGQAKGGAVFALVPTITLTDVTYEGSIAVNAAGTAGDSVDVFLTP